MFRRTSDKNIGVGGLVNCCSLNHISWRHLFHNQMFSDLQYLISSLLCQNTGNMNRFMKHSKLHVATVQSVGKKGPCGRGNVA